MDQENLQVCKFGLRGEKMSSEIDFSEEAKTWARFLVTDESRRPGDYKLAMQRVARYAKVPFALLWSLHYRPSKTIPTSQYVALGRYLLDVHRRKYREERAVTLARTEFGRLLLSAADRLAGAKDGALE